MLKYDRTVTRTFHGVEIKYGLMSAKGDEPYPTVLLIMVGQNGTIDGYEKKYLKMSEHWRQSGFHVLVASNPEAAEGNTVRLAESVVKEEFKIPASKTNIWFFGHSDGARKGAWFANTCSFVRRMVLVNMPLKEAYFMRTVGALKSFNNRPSELPPVIVYGIDDPAYGIAKFMLELSLRWLEIHEEDTDHHFTGKLDEFISLPELMLDQK